MRATVDAFLSRYGADEARATEIRRMLLGISARMATVAGRHWSGAPCLERAERVHLMSAHSPGVQTLRLPAAPALAISAVREALWGAFDEAEDLTEGDDYAVDLDDAVLERRGAAWLRGSRTIRVLYTAGYTAAEVAEAEGYVPADAWTSGAAYETADPVHFDAGRRIYVAAADLAASTTPPPLDPGHWTPRDALLPEDLTEACLLQAGALWQRRTSLGLVGGSAGAGGSASYTALDLLPDVRATCEAYRRFL